VVVVAGVTLVRLGELRGGRAATPAPIQEERVPAPV
jgi:hypothetical protein